MPVQIKLYDHYQGDDWQGILKMGPIQVNVGTAEAPILEPMPNAFVSGKIEFKDDNGTVVYTLSTTPEAGEGTITVTSALDWEFKILKQPLPLPAGVWFWDFETIDSTGAVFTPYYGSMKIY